MQLFLGAVPIILRLFSKARGHLLFSNYSRNNLPKPTHASSNKFTGLYDIFTSLYENFTSLYAK